MKWFSERLYSYFAQMIAVDDVLFRNRSIHQDIRVYDTPLFGKMLVLDGAVQLTELDNHIYHELMAHVPLFAHGAVADVLILGGGDGGTLKEVLKHPVESVVMVEIDQAVIDVSREYFPDVSEEAFSDARVELVVADAAEFVAREKRKFDLILIDSTDPVGAGSSLFTRNFYLNCRSRLRADGAVVAQSGTPLFAKQQSKGREDAFQSVFGRPEQFVALVPSYPTGMVALNGATLQAWSLNPPIILTRKRLARSGICTRHYCPETHRGSFEVLGDAAGRSMRQSRAEVSVEQGRGMA